MIAIAIFILSEALPTSAMDDKDVLENLRGIVIANEEAMSLIKFNYRAEALKTRPIPSMPGRGNIRRATRPNKYTLGVWAQNGIRLHQKEQDYYDDHTLSFAHMQVVDGEVKLSANMANEEQITVCVHMGYI